MFRDEDAPPLWGVLRALTGHFDPSTVYTLIADSRSFHLWQRELEMCKNLLFLNVSHCRLAAFNVLTCLTRLRYLDISCNKIVRLDQVHKLETLRTLKAFANQIKELEDLRDLSRLSSLTCLYLQRAGGREACPVCHLPDYRRRVLCLLHHGNSVKDLDSSRKNLCHNLYALEERRAPFSNKECLSEHPARQRKSPRAGLSLNPPFLPQQTDASPMRLTRLRILDGLLVHLPDWNEQAICIRDYVLRQVEGARCLREAVAKACSSSAYLPQTTKTEATGFSQYTEKLAGLQAAFIASRKALSDFQKLQESIT